MVTSPLNILPGLDLVASFAVLFPALIGPLLREAFLECLCWIVSNCSSVALTIILYSVLSSGRHRQASSWDQKVGVERSQDPYSLGSLSDESHSTESYRQQDASCNHIQLPSLALLGW